VTGPGRSFPSFGRPAGGFLLLVLAGSLLVAGAGCGGDDDSASPPLEGTEWTLVSGVDAPADAVPTLLLEDGNASGFSGCNRFAGGYELDGDSLSLGQLAGTSMACEEPQMETELAYTQALASVDAWAVEGGELVLSSEGAEILRYAAPAS
jgi:heat shock protein HslJ